MSHDDRSLARALREVPAAEPPAELLEKIQAEIPRHLALAEAPPSVVPIRSRPGRWLVAASLATVLGGGALAWWVVAQAPRLGEEPVSEAAAAAGVASDGQLETTSPGDAGAAVEEPLSPPPAGRAADEADSALVALPMPEADAVMPGRGAMQDAAAAAPAAAAPAGPLLHESVRRREAPVTQVRLEVRVVDAAGAPVPGATVMVVGVERRRAVTGADGRAVFPGLPNGRYAVEASAPGVGRAAGEVRLGDAGELAVVLRLSGPVEETIEVIAESPRTKAQHMRSTADLPAPKTGDERRRQPPEHMGPIRLQRAPEPLLADPAPPPPSTGGTHEPNDQPYGDVFYRTYGVNPFVDTEDDALATFGLEVDTGSWGVVQRYLRDGHRPPPEAVRVEEIVNAFRYRDPAPRGETFGLTAAAAPTPWASGARTWLLRVGVRARDVEVTERRPGRLTFVVDVSGSMAREDRLGLVKRSLALLVDELRPEDRVALVVYGSSGRVVLPHTADHRRLRAAIEELVPEGATNAEEGLRLAYDLAVEAYLEGAINRVILCSDGVANVGRTGPESILAAIGAAARRGIELTTVGFGMGNYNDVLMEQLADRGNGRYAYVDRFADARRLFVEELTGTLQTVAEEARAQVELDPAVVQSWRLLGYENRDIADERFRDDTVDAGEIGAGLAVTALFEVKLQPEAPRHAPWGEARVRYRPEGSERFEETSRPLGAGDRVDSWARADDDLRLAAVAARFAEVLRGSYWARDANLDQLLAEARAIAAERRDEPRAAELVAAIERLRTLAPDREE